MYIIKWSAQLASHYYFYILYLYSYPQIVIYIYIPDNYILAVFLYDSQFPLQLSPLSFIISLYLITQLDLSALQKVRTIA